MISRELYRRVQRSSGRNSSTWLLKKILVSFIVVGALSFMTVGGAFGLLSTEATNRGATVSSGTLTFNNVVNGSATACTSWGTGATGNSNPSCDPLFLGTSQNYPGTPAVATVKLTNDGSLDGSNLKVYMTNCTKQATPGAPAGSQGGGDPCATGGAQFYVQETDASGTATTCWFPSGSTTCAFVANSLKTFAANSASAGLDLGAGPAHGQARYFKIGMQLPSGASNTLQGEEAAFTLNWILTA